jgi:hypothetical protein
LSAQSAGLARFDSFYAPEPTHQPADGGRQRLAAFCHLGVKITQPPLRQSIAAQ